MFKKIIDLKEEVTLIMSSWPSEAADAWVKPTKWFHILEPSSAEKPPHPIKLSPPTTHLCLQGGFLAHCLLDLFLEASMTPCAYFYHHTYHIVTKCSAYTPLLPTKYGHLQGNIILPIHVSSVTSQAPSMWKVLSKYC